MKTRSLRQTALALVGSATFFGCLDSSTDSGNPDIEAQAVLENVASKVILATYADLAVKAAGLSEAVTDFDGDPTEAKLAAARNAWKAARRPWEQSEAFLFGPVDSKGIDPSIDTWPVNAVDLKGVLASSAALNTAYVDNLADNLKGFHTLEYLLFGNLGKPVSAFTSREREFLKAATASFQAATAKLETSWSATGENFIANFKEFGPGKLYQSQKAAVQELINGMIDICDEVATGKIGGPFGDQDRSGEESQFSDNSNADFADNIRGVQNVYLGHYGAGSSGNGLGELVKVALPDVDTRFTSEIEAAILAIGEMTPSFGEAIISNKPKVQAAQAAILKVQKTLEVDVLPIVAD